jgi:hypothetical protein
VFLRGAGSIVAHEQSNEMPGDRRLILVKAYGRDHVEPTHNGSTDTLDQAQLIRTFDLSHRRQAAQISFNRAMP